MHRIVALAGVILFSAAFAAQASASHSWGGYHWARTSNPFTVKVIDSMTPDWDGHLDAALGDWTTPYTPGSPDVMNAVEEAGDDRQNTRKRCPAVRGKARSCNAAYGQNGWLGLASIWASGSHIVQATAKMNDTYFATAAYSAPYKKQHVICQEIGHDWGLGHQDESGADLGTCMDYDRALDNEHPDHHDYEQLASIYAHLDSTTTLASAATTGGNPGLAGNEHAQPVAVERVDRIATSTITRTYADGTRLITNITWALGSPRAEHAGNHDH